MAKGKKTGGKNWQPGQSGNPKGSEGFPVDLKVARKLTQVELERCINKYMNLSHGELLAELENPATTMLEKMIASIVDQSVSKGDQLRLDFILNRVIGKVQERIEVTTPTPFILRTLAGGDVVMGIEKKEEE